MEQRFETFTTQITKIGRSIRKIKTEEMMEYNLKSPHVSCLYYVYKNDCKLTATQLCEICDEDKAAISRAVDHLEKNGYVTIQSSDQKKYKCPIILTEKGLSVAQCMDRKVEEILDKASSGLSEKDREIFYKALILISENLHSICKNY